MKSDPNIKKQREPQSAKHPPDKTLKAAPGQQTSVVTEASSDRLRMLAADRLRHFETFR